MTAEPDLLPLPEPVAVKYPDSGLRDDEHALRLWAAHGYDTGGEPLFSAEQLREATAPLQAEIEALRAEVSAVKESLSTDLRAMRAERERAMEARQLISDDLAKSEARAERLAEALRGLVEYVQETAHHNAPAAAAARAAVAELIEAIKPLAALDLRPDGFDKRDDSQPVYARDNSVITVGDVRRAAAALAACQSPTDKEGAK